jgi:hypothetical protein
MTVGRGPRTGQNGPLRPWPGASRSASMSTVTTSFRVRSLDQPVTRHRWSRRTAAVISAPLISSDLKSSLILINTG